MRAFFTNESLRIDALRWMQIRPDDYREYVISFTLQPWVASQRLLHWKMARRPPANWIRSPSIPGLRQSLWSTRGVVGRRRCHVSERRRNTDVFGECNPPYRNSWDR